MGKTKLIVAGILAVALLVAGGVAAYAGDGATVIKDVGCAIIPADSGLSETIWTTDVIAVVTPSGNTMLSCHFDVPDDLELPIKAVKHAGFLCGTPGGMTYDSQAVTTPGGKVVLNCQIKANAPAP